MRRRSMSLSSTKAIWCGGMTVAFLASAAGCTRGDAAEKAGQVVREGAPLLQIDPRRESANLSNQVAAKAQREANLALAKRNASRSAALFREGLVSRQQLEQDQSQATVA